MRAKMLSMIGVALILFGLLYLALRPRQVQADGSERLGPPLGIVVSTGTDIRAAGAGMARAEDANGQPQGEILLTLSDTVQVKQVLLYWEGHMTNDTLGDDTILVNGVYPITGQRIGGPVRFFKRAFSSSYRADITALNLIRPGPNRLTLDDLTFTRATNGAGILVVLDDGAVNATIDLRDGVDLAYAGFAGDQQVTVAQTFTFAAVDAPRIATLALFFSSVEKVGERRPSAFEVTVGNVTIVFTDKLKSNDGNEWDTVNLRVPVPAGENQLTVQAFSRAATNDQQKAKPPKPASFAWIAAGFTVGPPKPGLQITTSTNLKIVAHSFASDVPRIAPGDPVTWQYKVSNVGNIAFQRNELTLTDSILGLITTTVITNNDDDILAPGETWVFQATGQAQALAQAPQEVKVPGCGPNRFAYRNEGRVTGVTSEGTASASHQSYYCNPEFAELDLETAINGDDADRGPGPVIITGGPVIASYQITNLGQALISNLILTEVQTVTDSQGVVTSQLVTLTCAKDHLAPAEVMGCTLPSTASAGQHTHHSRVCGQAGGQSICAEDSSYYLGGVVRVDLEKFTNGQTVDDPNDSAAPRIAPGSPVTWSYRVLNLGNLDVAAASVVVTDDQLGPITTLIGQGDGDPALEPGEVWIYQASGTASALTAASRRTGCGDARPLYRNLGQVTVSALGASATDSDLSYYCNPATVELKLTTKLNGQNPADVIATIVLPAGGPITWSYTIENIGQTLLTNLAMTNTVGGGAVTCPQNTLAPGEMITCTAADTALAGEQQVTATVRATGAGQAVSAADVSSYLGAAAQLAIRTLTNDDDANTPPGPLIPVGETVRWRYVVSNNGTVPLTSITVVDDHTGPIACPQTALGPNETMTCHADGLALAGHYHNVGTVNGVDLSFSRLVSATDPSHYFGAVVAVAFKKFTNGSDADTPPGPLLAPGAAVTWTYHITNTGNVTLNNLAVADDRGVTVHCPEVAALAPGAALRCYGAGQAQSGQYVNMGSVQANAAGRTVTAQDRSHYYGMATAPIDLETAINSVDADLPPGLEIAAGANVTWSYVVRNPGPSVLSNVAVTDSVLGDLCALGTLAVGETKQCMALGVAAVGPQAQHSRACADTAAGLVCDEDATHYVGVAPADLRIKILTNGEAANAPPGPALYADELVTWTYLVTNTGVTDQPQVVVTSTRVGSTTEQIAVLCPVSALAAGQSMVCHGAGLAGEGQYVVSGAACDQSVRPPRCVSDESHYRGAPLPVIVVRPERATRLVGETHAVTATIRGEVLPAAALTVTFAVAGAHNLPPTIAPVDSAGNALFQYPGATFGRDWITATLYSGARRFAATANAIWCGNLDLAVTSPSRIVGTPGLALATATDARGQRLANQPLYFAVSGINTVTLTSTLPTDANGQTPLAYPYRSGKNSYIQGDPRRPYSDTVQLSVHEACGVGATGVISWIPISMTLSAANVSTQVSVTLTPWTTIAQTAMLVVTTQQTNLAVSDEVKPRPVSLSVPGQGSFTAQEAVTPLKNVIYPGCDIHFSGESEWKLEAWVDLDGNNRANDEEPTCVVEEPTLSPAPNFVVQALADAVTLVWETGTEFNVAGYNLYRATTPAGPYSRLNDDLIVAYGDPFGARYEQLDQPPAPGLYYYQLESIATDGTTARTAPLLVAYPEDGSGEGQLYLPVVAHE